MVKLMVMSALGVLVSVVAVCIFFVASTVSDEAPRTPTVNAHVAGQLAAKNEDVAYVASSSATIVKPVTIELDDLVSQSKLSKDWLRLHGFEANGALTKLKLLVDGRVEPAGQPRNILTMTPGENSLSPDNTTPRMDPRERYVHARMKLGSERSDDSVILRWRNLSEQQVIELSSQEMPKDRDDMMQLWMHRTEDWQPGHYRLEVIQGDQNLQLLARSDFEITAYGAPVTAFEFPIVVESK